MRIRIVHAASDGALAAALAGRLEALALTPSWADGAVLDPGPAWLAEERGVREADAVLLLATDSFAASPSVWAQGRLAARLGKPVLAVEAGGEAALAWIEAAAPGVVVRVGGDLAGVRAALGLPAAGLDAAAEATEADQRLLWRLGYLAERLAYLGEPVPLPLALTPPLDPAARQRLHWRARYLAGRIRLRQEGGAAAPPIAPPIAPKAAPDAVPRAAPTAAFAPPLAPAAEAPPLDAEELGGLLAGEEGPAPGQAPAAPLPTPEAVRAEERAALQRRVVRELQRLIEGPAARGRARPSERRRAAADGLHLGRDEGKPAPLLSRLPWLAQEGLLPRLERASVSAFAPAAARPGARVLVQAYVHTPLQAATVREMAGERDAAAVRKGVAGLNLRLAPLDRLRLVLEADGLRVKRPEQVRIWLGEPVEAAFELDIPRFKRPRSYVLRLRLEANGAPAGELAFTLAVEAGAERQPSPQAQLGYHAYRYVFCSYASEDRAAVLARTQMLQRLGVGFFQDIASLRAGEAWRPALERHMGEADVVMLFWSKAAARSDWVRQEVEWALDLQARSPEALPRILPVLLDGPPPPKPPKSLAHLHFDDPLRAIAKAWE